MKISDVAYADDGDSQGHRATPHSSGPETPGIGGRPCGLDSYCFFGGSFPVDLAGGLESDLAGASVFFLARSAATSTARIFAWPMTPLTVWLGTMNVRNRPLLPPMN